MLFVIADKGILHLRTSQVSDRCIANNNFRLLLFKNWFKNVIARGLDENQDDLIKIIEETGEVEAMVYNLERTIKEEIKKSRDQGIQEGKLEGKLEIVKRLLQSGVNIEIIMKATGFSESEIVRIKIV